MEDAPEYLRGAAGLVDEKSHKGKPPALSAAELVRVVSALNAVSLYVLDAEPKGLFSRWFGS